MPVREAWLESNKAIAGYFSANASQRRGVEGADKEKRVGVQRTAGAKPADHGGDYPFRGEPLGTLSSGPGMGLISNPPPADSLNPAGEWSVSPKLALATVLGPAPVPSACTQQPAHLPHISIFELFPLPAGIISRLGVGTEKGQWLGEMSLNGFLWIKSHPQCPGPRITPSLTARFEVCEQPA